MKLLTVMIPCYNSAAYMNKAVDSLLCVKEDLDIIIINDGSTDDTEKIALKYQEEYPQHIRAVSQENKGHGGAINTGISLAEGKYFKVLDSDDRLEETALKEVIKTLKKIEENNQTLDMLISNYTYDKVDKMQKRTMSYTKLPKNKLFSWEEEFALGKFEYMLMHSIIYKTEILRKSGMILPEKISYEDDVYAFVPLKLVEYVYYLDVDLYMYFIGREDQTVNEKNMIKKRHQYETITNIIVDEFLTMTDLKPKKYNYMLKFVDLMMGLASIVLIMSGTDEDYERKDAMWQNLKQKDKKLYDHLKMTTIGLAVTTKKRQRYLVMPIYKILKKIWGFN